MKQIWRQVRNLKQGAGPAVFSPQDQRGIGLEKR
jgi:hypothetical protein